ncbi:hypothetical protein BJ741DRAFT_605748 [Chytriomyces cf. hyalinus JEL632]|nr:hypothetical protein BJ741DRAFT_605748 [Chytriomyces cf. hyalinus JEL632]
MPKNYPLLKELAVGVAFGFALEKAKVYLPSVIVHQLQWTELSMLVVFLTATLTGRAAISCFESLGLYLRAPKPPTAIGFNMLNSYGANVLGGAAIGVGMALAGACPGTVLVQVATGIPTAPWVVAGALIASSTYGYLHKHVVTAVPKFGSKRASQTFESKSVSFGAIAFAASLVGFPGLYYINSLIPWKQQVFSDLMHDFHISRSNMSGVEFDATAWKASSAMWSPFAAGIAIGAAQVFSILLTRSVIGASGLYPYLGSWIVRGLDAKWETRAPFYKSFINSISTLYFSGGVIAGAYLSMKMGASAVLHEMASNQSAQLVLDPALVLRLMVGGFLLVYGSRVAGGCTSGHGLSGIAQLSVASVVTVAAMFGAGTIAAQVVGPFSVSMLQ